MNKELEQKIYQRWPKWFRPDGPIQETLIPFGLECGDGWFQIIWDLCEEIEKILPADVPFEIVQVKEKFAELRVYFHGAGTYLESVYKLVDDAEEKSRLTCEDCGKPGMVRSAGWLKTLCDEHSGGKPPLGVVPADNTIDLTRDPATGDVVKKDIQA